MTKKLRKKECKFEDSLSYTEIQKPAWEIATFVSKQEKKKKGQKIKIIIFIWNKILYS